MDLGGNPLLGDDGMQILAPALSDALVWLAVNDCNIGDRGMNELGAVLPSKGSLRRLDVGFSPAVTPKGWASLGDAVARMPHLEELYCSECSGMGCTGVASLVATLPVRAAGGGSQLSKLDLSKCNIKDEGAKSLASMLERCLEEVCCSMVIASSLNTPFSETDIGVGGMQAAGPYSIMRTLSGLSVWGNPFVATGGKDVLVSAATTLRQRQESLGSAEADQGSDSDLSDEDNWPRLRIVLVEPSHRSPRDSPRNEGPEFWDPEHPADTAAQDAWSSSSSISWDAAAEAAEDGDGVSDDLNLIDDVAAVEDDAAAQDSPSEDEMGDSDLQRALQASVLDSSAHTASCVVHTTGFSPVRSSSPPGSNSDSDHTKDISDGEQADDVYRDVRTASVGAGACAVGAGPQRKKRKARVVMESDDEEEDDEEA
jgi:hypothetical protein